MKTFPPKIESLKEQRRRLKEEHRQNELVLQAGLQTMKKGELFLLNAKVIHTTSFHFIHIFDFLTMSLIMCIATSMYSRFLWSTNAIGERTLSKERRLHPSNRALQLHALVDNTSC